MSGGEWMWTLSYMLHVELNILTMFLQLLLANLKMGLLRESKRFYVLNMVYKCMFDSQPVTNYRVSLSK